MKFDLFSVFQGFLASQRENLLLWVPVFLGVGSAVYFGLSTEPAFLTTGAALAGSISFFAMAFYAYHKKPDSISSILLTIFSGCILLIAIGFTAAQFKTDLVKTPMLSRETRPVMVTAILDHREDQEGKKGTLLFLSDVTIENWDAKDTPRKLRITSRKKTDAIAGDHVRLLAKLTPLSPPVAPEAYDFGRHYYFEEIGALGYGLSAVEIIERASPTLLNLENLRTKISKTIMDTVPERQAGIVSALMTGERAAISDEDWDALRASGLAHIISISGMHVVMVAVPVFFLIRLFLALVPTLALRWPIKKIAAAIALTVCCLYVGLVVPSVPTTRALLMTGVGLIAIMLDRSPFSLRLVAFSAILVLLISPESIWSVSFQMSFAAVTALVAVADSMRPVLTRFYDEAGFIKRGLLFVAGALVTSLVASITTAPYSLYHFQQMASYSVLANALSMPVSGIIIMPFLILSYILIPFGAAEWCLKITGMGVEWLLDIARWTQGLPGAVITTPALPETVMVMVSIAGLALILFHGWAKLWSLLPLFIALLSIATYRTPDILVSGDGMVVAVRGDENIYVSSDRKNKFAVETWLKRWGKKPDDVIKFSRQGIVNTEDGVNISCEPAACRIEKQSVRLSFGKGQYELKQDCDWANIIISEARLNKDFCGDRPVRVFGYYELFRESAIAITSGKNIRIETVGEDRGQRPWSIKNGGTTMSSLRHKKESEKN